MSRFRSIKRSRNVRGVFLFDDIQHSVGEPEHTGRAKSTGSHAGTTDQSKVSSIQQSHAIQQDKFFLFRKQVSLRGHKNSRIKQNGFVDRSFGKAQRLPNATLKLLLDGL